MGWFGNDRLNRLGVRKQICWYCKKCIGKCSWSKDYIPVPGWDAEEDCLNYPDGGMHKKILTYKIFDCPLFEANKEGKELEKNQKRYK